jgi:hypothetical protein
MADNKVITPEVRVSYPALHEPRVGPNGGEPKYGAALVFPHGADLSALKKSAGDALQERWGAKAMEMVQKGQLKWPFRDGSQKYGPGTTFINVTSKQPPGIVDRFAGPDGKPRPITDPSEVYAGCYARASVRPFTYDVNGSKGVSFGLNNLQKLREGERLDGRMNAADEFDATESGPADIDDLMS